MIDDGEYASKSLCKLLMYDRNGFQIGENLIISMESQNIRFDGKRAEELIKKYCL